MSSNVGRLVLIGLAGLVMSPFGAAEAAPLGASDTASPVYRSSFTPSDGNKFDCNVSFGYCDLTLTTKPTAYPCTQEIITLPSTAVPALLYSNTFCSVSLFGRLHVDLLEQSSPICVLDGTQAIDVSFSSGANFAFNGQFQATATFKPTGFYNTTNVNRARITIKGGGLLAEPPGATGSIFAQFDVAFGGTGLTGWCYNANASGLSTVVSGTVTTRF